MPNKELIERWERIRGHLARAWVELPPGDHPDLRWYQEFMDHNELGLAMDVLAEIGEADQASAPFWLALSDAAREMDEQPKADYFKSRGAASV